MSRGFYARSTHFMSTHSSLSLAGECEKCVSFVCCMFSQEFIGVRTCRTGLVLKWSNKQIATNYFACFMKLEMLLSSKDSLYICHVHCANSYTFKTPIKASGFHVKLYGLPKGKQARSRKC